MPGWCGERGADERCAQTHFFRREKADKIPEVIFIGSYWANGQKSSSGQLSRNLAGYTRLYYGGMSGDDTGEGGPGQTAPKRESWKVVHARFKALHPDRSD